LHGIRAYSVLIGIGVADVLSIMTFLFADREIVIITDPPGQ
jgi:hypothetical protein